MKYISRIRYTLIVMLVLVALSAAQALAFRGYVQERGDVILFWGNGDISVSKALEVDPEGFDATHQTSLAVRKAAVEARRKMLEAVYAIRIDAASTVGAYLAEDDEADAQVRRLIQNSRLELPEFAEGKGTLAVQASLRGELASLILPPTIPFQSGIPPRLSLGLDTLAAMNTVEPTSMMAGSGTYTGLVVDATLLSGAEPALAPVVYGRDGVGVYGAFSVSRESAVRNGVVSYSTTADPVQLRSRVGNRPLVVTALAVVGSGKTDFIISGADAELARILLKDSVVTDQCRVVIALGKKTEDPEEDITEEIQP
ncbi:hypothetical protein [Salidesulfovibrio onnuriiensis]|uniref:hypothetical protein n=1 Tax=Salidesulfovibrio onnuriiensis TaxID=2583823 RepID=UPI0011C8090A|nr:hypothetical protein [Salidesulfovibrio onnuriiensis]